MLRHALLLPAMVVLVRCQTITSRLDIVPTPDALPVTGLRDFDVPTYTETPGLDSDIVFYATETAIAAAAADQTASPLSVFPAVTSVPINAAGQGSTPTKRGIERRSACDPQATIANYYNVNVDSYSAFKADPTISSIALAAPTPSGYVNNFKNLPGANSAYAYMGYAVVNQGQTGYDTNWCANKCNSISGCLSFNIYFERDPVVEPGTGCTNPSAFANIKCSFWGTALDDSTASNSGQWRNDFQVGIAGSNAYSASKVGGQVSNDQQTSSSNGPTSGGPVPNYQQTSSLDGSTMNAPLYDCSNTWTYLGYKLFQSGPYDPQLCAAACDAQTAYNVAHPPSSGQAVKCAAFGTYILTMTNKTSSYQLGQMCTMYTSDWDKKYAVNTVAYDDGIGARYTYTYSFFYSRADSQPVCAPVVSTISSTDAGFCSSFLTYSAPTVTSTVTSTATGVVVDVSTTTVSTFTSYGTGTATTITSNIQWKRDATDSATNSAADSNAAPTGSNVATASSGVSTALPDVLSNNATYATVDYVPDYTAVTLGTYIATVTVTSDTAPTDLPDNIIVVAPANPTKRAVLPRAIATPASISTWPASRISSACSSLVTGTVTTTVTTTLPQSHGVSYVSTVATITLQACVVPSQLPDYASWNAVWGTWNGSAPGDSANDIGGTSGTDNTGAQQEKTLQLPFAIFLGGGGSPYVTVGINGYIKLGQPAYYQLVPFTGQGSFLYIYKQANGVFYRITGPVGSRQVTFAWYTGTFQSRNRQQHFTITYFEKSRTTQFKYYDIDQGGSYEASAYVISGAGGNGIIVKKGSPFNAGDQYQITFPYNPVSYYQVTSVFSRHNRVDCCVKRPDISSGGWHSCTEYQPAVES